MMLKKLLTKLSQKGNSIKILIFCTGILGSLTWILTMVRSGICGSPYCLDGRSFWGPNGHDGIWHVALAESFNRGAWSMPVFAGETLKNYHLGFDILLSVLSKLTAISVMTLYFQIIPVVFSLLTGIVLYKFVFNWTNSRAQALWVIFFTYFGGSLGWIITFLRDGELGGESVFWAQQSISTLVNPPFALSLIILFSALSLLNKGLNENSTKLLSISAVLFGTLVQIKIYAGVLSLLALFVAAIWLMLKRAGFSLFKVFLTALIISILIFPSVNLNSGSGLVFKPFWFLETMMFLSDRVGWEKFGEAMVNYKTGGVWIKFFPAYLFAFLILLIGNLGTRIIALPYMVGKIRNWKNFDYLDLMITTIIFSGITIPLFFLQEGTPWNTIQFMYYSLVFSGIFAGISFGKFVESSKLNTTLLSSIVVFVIILTIPTTIGTLRYVYLPIRPPSYVGHHEIEALHFLSGQPEGLVLTYPYDSAKAKEAESNPPRPLYLYESTAYVSALSKHDVYLEDEVNLNITGYDWRGRRDSVESWYKETDESTARNFLLENNISYIYWVKEKYDDISQRALLGDSQLGLIKIFENDKAIIFKVD